MSALSAPRLVGVALLGLGLVAAVEVLRIKDDWAGARLVPAVVALALLGLGGTHLIARDPGRPAADAASSGSPPGTRPGPRAGTRTVTLVLALLVAYVGLLPRLGFLPATAALVAVLLRRLGAYGWPVTISLGLGIALASHVVFRVWLGMALPDGLLAR